MKLVLRFAAFLTSAAFVLAPARADNAAQTLPFSQNWTNTGLITTADDLDGRARHRRLPRRRPHGGHRRRPADAPRGGRSGRHSTSTPTRRLRIRFATGGVTEFDIADDVVALAGQRHRRRALLQALPEHDRPVGHHGAYNLRDIDGSADNAMQQVALHFRVGASGALHRRPRGVRRRRPTGGAATLVTPVCAVLPAAANNQALVQVRVMTRMPWATTSGSASTTSSSTPPVAVPCCRISRSTTSALPRATPAPPTSPSRSSSRRRPAPAASRSTSPPRTAPRRTTTPATEDNDYVAQSLTGQTIPAGSSTYTFTVLVNGDVVLEPNETFFVNVTNVTGATVTDGQGQGTIVNDDSPNLTINDVALNEGNAGTTTFTFTVSLSAPAGPGGVTFDIATADGTAQDDNPVTEDNDYVAQSLTGQTIPAGSSTYTFNVLVNGDTTPEAERDVLRQRHQRDRRHRRPTARARARSSTTTSRQHPRRPGHRRGDADPGRDRHGRGRRRSATSRAATSCRASSSQEEDADADADPATSEGIFVFCSALPDAGRRGPAGAGRPGRCRSSST